MKNLLVICCFFSISSLWAQSGVQAFSPTTSFKDLPFLAVAKHSGPITLNPDQQKELEAIMTVIKAETDCFYNRDIDCWKEHWVQDEHTFQGWNNSDGTFDAIIGWKNVEQAATAYIKANPVQTKKDRRRKVFRKNMVVKFYSAQLAYLVWDQYNESRDGKSYTHSKDSRIMEKHNGQWKIANVTAFWDYENLVMADQLE